MWSSQPRMPPSGQEPVAGRNNSGAESLSFSEDHRSPTNQVNSVGSMGQRGRFPATRSQGPTGVGGPYQGSRPRAFIQPGAPRPALTSVEQDLECQAIAIAEFEANRLVT